MPRGILRLFAKTINLNESAPQFGRRRNRLPFFCSGFVG
jgi:hypothetical protein